MEKITLTLIKKRNPKIEIYIGDYIKIGDYVSFDTTNNTLYKVKDKSHNYILVEDSTGTFWERREYIEKIYIVKKEGK